MKERSQSAADHAGYDMSSRSCATLRARVRSQRCRNEFTCRERLSGFRHPVARGVSNGEVRRAYYCVVPDRVWRCSPTANPHVRAALVWNPGWRLSLDAHNDANIWCIRPASSRRRGTCDARAWLNTTFENGRHTPRVTKIERPEE